MNTANRERRPLWQRLSLPVLGAVMIIIGAFGLIIPIMPGILLFAFGFPLLFCFHQASEDWAIGVEHRWYGWFRQLFIRKAPTTRQDKSRVE
jgi:uncharacterized membrane protein YbaN (DUF454 family)